MKAIAMTRAKKAPNMEVSQGKEKLRNLHATTSSNLYSTNW